MKVKLSHHKSIETLPIANFEKVRKTNNLSYLYDAKFLDCEKHKANVDMLKSWNKINDEYTKVISKRNTAKDIMNKRAELAFYETENMKVKLICHQIILGVYDESFADMLEESGYRFNEDEDRIKQAEVIFKQSDNFLTKINMVSDELEKLMKVGKDMDLEETKVLFRKHLEVGDVNIYTTTVKEWLFYEDELIKAFNKKSVQ